MLILLKLFSLVKMKHPSIDIMREKIEQDALIGACLRRDIVFKYS